MTKHNQVGAVSGVGISLILTIVLLLGAIGFGGWAFTSRQDYKDNSDTKVNAAVEIAKKQESAVKDKQFTEASKNPLKTYNGPETYGSMVLKYPKTWSGYVSTDVNGGAAPFDGYFATGIVPSLTDKNSIFALRIQVIGQSYPQVLQQLGQQAQPAPTVSAYDLPKLPKVVGVKVVGKANQKDNVTMVVLPLRAQTLEIWTEGTQYIDDFNNYILPNFSFSP